MPTYVPSHRYWVREQVELYESSGGTKGTILRDTGLPVILVTHTGNKTGAIRKTPLMRLKDGDSYVLVGSQGGAQKDPVWVYNPRANPQIELRDETVVRRCGLARSRTRLIENVCGPWPSRRIRHTPNTRHEQPAEFPSLSLSH
jgi:deazaflavin-dependent oxidoreductase (nitroreductase family)